MAYEDMFIWDFSFQLVSQFLNNFRNLPLFNFLIFSNDGWNLNAFFVDNSQVALNN